MNARSSRTAAAPSRQQRPAARASRAAKLLRAIDRARAESLEPRWLLANISGTVFNDLNADGAINGSDAGLAGWTTYIDANNDGHYTTNAPTTPASSDVPKAIPDADINNTPSTVTSSLVVSAGATSVADVNVNINISHTYDGDLTIVLIGPGNTNVILADRVGDDGDNFTNTTFDDEASSNIVAGTAPFSGSYNPSTPLSALDGTNPNGTWKLQVTDNSHFDTGTINSWSLTLTTGEQVTTTSSTGAYSFTGLSSGTYHVGTILQPNYQFTVPSTGVRTVVLGSSDATNQNFGVRLPPGQIQGVKWSDLNGNGVQDAGEPRLANVQIYADLNDDGQYESATEPSTFTDANGNYTLNNLAPGSYIVEEVAPANSTQTYPGTFGAAPPATPPAPLSQDVSAGGSNKIGASGTAPSTASDESPGTASLVATLLVPGAKVPQLPLSSAGAAAGGGGSGSNIIAGDASSGFSKIESTGISADFTLAPTGRWSSTAKSGSNLKIGDPTVLTWSIVPDGTPIVGGEGEAASASNLQQFLNSIYLSQTVWQPLIQQALDTWSRDSGVTYVYEPNDDGVTDSAGITGDNTYPGVAGVRGDVRIGGHNIDGTYDPGTGLGGILAYTYYPQVGDMVIDTGDTYLKNDTSNDSLALRNVIAHEDGHGLGLDHVYPVNQTKLMEPFLSTNFVGPQLDDILAANRLYGDPLEQGLNNAGPNDTPGLASDLGSLSTNGSYDAQTIMDGIYTAAHDPGVGALSIDDNSDVDYFKFTIPTGKRVSLSLNPVGTSYLAGPSDIAVTTFNAKAQSDLALQLIGPDGTTVLASANVNGAGLGEQINNFSTGAGNSYYVRITGSADAAQLYSLGLTLSTNQPGSWAVDVGAAQTISNVNFGNHLNINNRLLFYNNSSFDGQNPAANAADDGAIATDKTALLPGAGTATFANYSSYASGINGIMIDLSGIASNQTPTFADFMIQEGTTTTSTDPATWAAGPTPTVTIRRGAGANGSDRVELTWADNVAVKGEWMRVSVLPSARTGLTSTDVFYFGNEPGDTGNDAGTTAPVDVNDYFDTRNHFRSYDNLAPITWKWDFNRDGVTDGMDLQIVRAGATTSATALNLISPPALPATLLAGPAGKTTGSSSITTPTPSPTSTTSSSSTLSGSTSSSTSSTTTTSSSSAKPSTPASPPKPVPVRPTFRFGSIMTAGGVLRTSSTMTTQAPPNAKPVVTTIAGRWGVVTSLVPSR